MAARERAPDFSPGDSGNAGVRAAGRADIALIGALLREYAAGLPVDLGYQEFKSELAGLPGAYAPPGGALFLASVAGGAAGCVAVRPLSAKDCEIKRLFVRPLYRGRGLARQLALAALRHAAQAGFAAVKLDTLAEMAPAIRLYQSLGFEACAPYGPPAPPGTLYFELRARRDGT